MAALFKGFGVRELADFNFKLNTSQLAATNKILFYPLFRIPQLVGRDAPRDYPGIAGQLTANLRSIAITSKLCH